MATERTGFAIHFDKFELLDGLDDASFHAVMHALFVYAKTGEVVDIADKSLNVIFGMMRQAFDAGDRKNNARSQAARDAADARWNANGCEAMRSDANAMRTDADTMRIDANECVEMPNSNSNSNCNSNCNSNGIHTSPATQEKCVVTRARAHRFVPPTVAEVAAYCAEKGYRVDAERFVAYYESNGWHVGRNPMKDWRAAVRTWTRNDAGYSAPQTAAMTASDKARAFLALAGEDGDGA